MDSTVAEVGVLSCGTPRRDMFPTPQVVAAYYAHRAWLH